MLAVVASLPRRLTVHLSHTTMTLWSSTPALPQRWRFLRRLWVERSVPLLRSRRPMSRRRRSCRRWPPGRVSRVLRRGPRTPGRRSAGPHSAISTRLVGSARQRIEPRARQLSCWGRSRRMPRWSRSGAHPSFSRGSGRHMSRSVMRRRPWVEERSTAARRTISIPGERAREVGNSVTGRGNRKPRLSGAFVSRGGRTRTCNPRFWRPVLYQLSHAPGLHASV